MNFPPTHQNRASPTTTTPSFTLQTQLQAKETQYNHMRMYYLQAIQQVIAVEEAAKTVLHCLMTTHKDITLLHVPMSLSSYTRQSLVMTSLFSPSYSILNHQLQNGSSSQHPHQNHFKNYLSALHSKHSNYYHNQSTQLQHFLTTSHNNLHHFNDLLIVVLYTIIQHHQEYLYRVKQVTTIQEALRMTTNQIEVSEKEKEQWKVEQTKRTVRDQYYLNKEQRVRSNSGYGVIDKESESKFNVKKEKLSNLYDYANAYYGSKVFSKPKRDLSMINLIKDNDNWKYHRSQMTKQADDKYYKMERTGQFSPLALQRLLLHKKNLNKSLEREKKDLFDFIQQVLQNLKFNYQAIVQLYTNGSAIYQKKAELPKEQYQAHNKQFLLKIPSQTTNQPTQPTEATFKKVRDFCIPSQSNRSQTHQKKSNQNTLRKQPETEKPDTKKPDTQQAHSNNRDLQVNNKKGNEGQIWNTLHMQISYDSVPSETSQFSSTNQPQNTNDRSKSNSKDNINNERDNQLLKYAIEDIEEFEDYCKRYVEMERQRQTVDVRELKLDSETVEKQLSAFYNPFTVKPCPPKSQIFSVDPAQAQPTKTKLLPSPLPTLQTQQLFESKQMDQDNSNPQPHNILQMIASAMSCNQSI